MQGVYRMYSRTHILIIYYIFIVNITIFLNVLDIHCHSKTLQPVCRMLKRWHWRHGRRAKATMFACLHMVKRDLERPSQCKDLRQHLRRFEDFCWQARKPLLITLTDSGEPFFCKSNRCLFVIIHICCDRKCSGSPHRFRVFIPTLSQCAGTIRAFTRAPSRNFSRSEMAVFTSSKKVTHLDKRENLDNDVFWTKKLWVFFFFFTFHFGEFFFVVIVFFFLCGVFFKDSDLLSGFLRGCQRTFCMEDWVERGSSLRVPRFGHLCK